MANKEWMNEWIIIINIIIIIIIIIITNILLWSGLHI